MAVVVVVIVWWSFCGGHCVVVGWWCWSVQVRGVVAVQRAVLVAEVEALRAEDRERQARQALSACHHRALRTRRIARLKALFSRTAQGALCFFGWLCSGWSGVCCLCVQRAVLGVFGANLPNKSATLPACLRPCSPCADSTLCMLPPTALQGALQPSSR